MKIQQQENFHILSQLYKPHYCAVAITLGLFLFCSVPISAADRNKEEITVAKNGSSMQKGRTVTITVTDESGPLIGANVTVKGTTNGNVTDANGYVILQNVPDDAVLSVSYIGYVSKEIPLGNQSSLRVRLAEDTKTLDEVVVIGYGTMAKKQVTSAVTSLSADDLMVGVSGSDISSALQGKIGGLIMTNLGSANSSTTFQLRGMTSINAGRAPLVVIDGFPGGDIRSLTQDDIKSIDVLKDASAGAI